MFNLLARLFDSNDKQIRKITPIIDEINRLEESILSLSDEQLRLKTEEFRKVLSVDLGKARTETDFDPRAQQEALLKLLPEAFAVVREAAKRVANHRHFDVQLMAGYFLANNKIIELFTGEGKTNAAALAMYLYGLTGRGAHLVTVNDYLARRDGEWNGHVMNALGITVGIINNGKQYRFISDEEAIQLKGDEARDAIEERKKLTEKVGRLKLDMMNGTNLVECTKKEAYACDLIYGTNNEFGFDYLRDNMARDLGDLVQGPLHFVIVDEADSILIDEARTPLIISQSAQDSNDMYKQFASLVQKLSPERDYSVDEKSNSVAISDEGIDRVEKLLGTQNVYEDAQMAYHLENALKAKELYKLDDEYIVNNGDIVIVDEFTGRALPGRRYSEGLHQAIEAKEGVEVKRESRTLATITLQNYFRLYNYLSGMTGTALTEAEEFANIYKIDVVVIPTNRPVVRIDETDVVYRTQSGKFRAIVEDIKESHAKGQPVLVGTTSVEKSETISRMLEEEGIPHNVLNAKQHEKEAHIVQYAGEKGAVTIATNMAGRGTDIALGDGVKEVGGLYVIGSERHESRRIDNQLRGRSGRQGDPGRSRFYVSFDDELMRLFGGDRMKAVMERVGMEDDMPISLGILGKTIENAQKKVEAHNFDIRKRLVEYDDVLNQQRNIVYSLRRKILSLLEDRAGLSNIQSELKQEDWKAINVSSFLEKLEGFSLKERDTWSIEEMSHIEWMNRPINYWILKRVITEVRTELAAQLQDDLKVDNVEERKVVAFINSTLTEEIADRAAKLLGYKDRVDLYRSLGENSNLSDQEDLLVNLALASFMVHVSEIRTDAMRELAKMLILQSIDNYWMEHLDAMADLREGIGMRSMAQKDPLVEYKNEGYMLFEDMLQSIDSAVVNRFFKVRVVREEPSLAAGARAVHESRQGFVGEALDRPRAAIDAVRTDNRPGAVSKQQTVVRESHKVGRNDPCPCGSGKKFKNCGLKNSAEHIKNMKSLG